MSGKQPDDRPPRPDPEGPVLPQVSDDEREEGWGEDRRGEDRDAEWYRRQIPPHHG